jgi:antitoxin ParD1/3/4
MAQINVSVPPALKSWIDSRVAEGRFSNPSDYLRDLVRRDQDIAIDERAWLRAEVQKGFESGIVDREPEDVLEDIIAEHPVSNG